MWMCIEACPGSHDVVVADEQQPVMGIRSIVVLAEAEAMVGVEPADLRSGTRISATDVDAGSEVLHLVTNEGSALNIPDHLSASLRSLLRGAHAISVSSLGRARVAARAAMPSGQFRFEMVATPQSQASPRP
jgi:hypothetical protein